MRKKEKDSLPWQNYHRRKNEIIEKERISCFFKDLSLYNLKLVFILQST